MENTDELTWLECCAAYTRHPDEHVCGDEETIHPHTIVLPDDTVLSMS